MIRSSINCHWPYETGADLSIQLKSPRPLGHLLLFENVPFMCKPRVKHMLL